MFGLEFCERTESSDATGRTVKFYQECGSETPIDREIVCIYRESQSGQNATLTISNPDGGFRRIIAHVASRIRSHEAAYPSLLGGGTRLNLVWSTTLKGVGPARREEGFRLHLRVGSPAEIAEVKRLEADAAEHTDDAVPTLVCLGGGPREAMFVRSLFDEVTS